MVTRERARHGRMAKGDCETCHSSPENFALEIHNECFDIRQFAKPVLGGYFPASCRTHINFCCIGFD